MNQIMNMLQRVGIGVGVALALLAGAAHFELVSVYWARTVSFTRNAESVNERRGDLVSTVHIERPIGRWIPFLKMGETLYRHSYQYPRDDHSIIERISTTRTRLLVIGLCSIRKYDELADAPFENAHLDYRSR